MQCSIFKIATCEDFLKNTKILNFKKKNKKTMHRRIKKNPKITFYISVPNFRALGPIMNFFLERYCPLK